MQDKIIMCQKIGTIITKKDKFKKLDDQYLMGILPDDEVLEVLWALNSFYTYFCKAIKLIYRQQGRRIQLPKQTFIEAQKDGYIKNGEAWLSYIEEMNVFFNTEDEKEQKKIAKEIIDTHRETLYEAFNQFCDSERQKFYKENISLLTQSENKDMEFADNKPEYTPEEIGITERSYEILLRFFRSEKSIKNVWMHGSRYFGTNTYASDIDIVIDCPFEEYNKFKNKMEDLSIPYMLDSKSIYDEDFKKYIKTTSILGTKKIYCAEDFTHI